MQVMTVFQTLVDNLAQRMTELRAGKETREMTMVEIRRRIAGRGPAERARSLPLESDPRIAVAPWRRQSADIIPGHSQA